MNTVLNPLTGLDSIYGKKLIDNDQNKRLKNKIQLSPVVNIILVVFSPLRPYHSQIKVPTHTHTPTKSPLNL